MKLRSAVASVAIFLGAASAASAQNTTADTTKALRVFIDCMYCDLDLIRTEMPWVDYMRDRSDAQVHVLVTNQGTGGGGTQFTLNFIGLKEYAAINDTLMYTTSSEDSNDATRRGLTRMIQLGMVPFAARTSIASRMKLTVAAPPADAGRTTAPKRDPWKAWVFRLGFNGSGDGESQSESKRYSGSASASRTTEQWKTSLNLNSSQNTQRFTFEIEEGRDTTINSFSRNSSANGSVVKSLGGNFSAGITGSVSTSTFGNTELSASIEPALEYDFFPYKESSRRMLTAQYSIGVRTAQYRDTTIYFQIEETHPHHSISLSYYTQEQWGSVNVYTSYSQYLHDPDFFNMGVGGNTDVKLFKGFSFNIFGDYSKVRDQLSLVKGDASQSEVLLRQRELSTSFRYFVGMGVSYRFGSIFNNVVNPRMGGGGGGGMIMYF
jgi:hypothetical protein